MFTVFRLYVRLRFNIIEQFKYIKVKVHKHWLVELNFVFFLYWLGTCFYENVNITSDQYLISTIYNLSSPFQCQDKCQSSPAYCAIFTFYGSNGTGESVCYLWSKSYGNKSISDGFISGPRYCYRTIGLIFQTCL